MSAINDILNNVPIPKMVKVRQNFESSVLENVDTELKNQLAIRISTENLPQVCLLP